MMKSTILNALLALALAFYGCGSKSETPEKAPASKPGAGETTNQKAPADDEARLKQYNAALREAAQWLLAQQKENGAFAEHAAVGITGLAVSALLNAPNADELRTHPRVQKAAKFLDSMQQEDGAINEPGVRKLANYQTSAAVSALAKLGKPTYQDLVKKGREYLVGIQREDGLNAGGWGYNSDKRADLSNTQMSLQALKAAGLPEDSEAFQNCKTFLQRCQNRSESNDQEFAGNDGGGIYYPGSSKAGTATLPNGKTIYKSYGSMTYALLRCYLLIGLEPDDPRVVAARNWLGKHFTVDENPGMDKQGLYYYYMTMAEALALLGKPTLELDDGTTVNWARRLGDKLLALQREDGSWVNEEMRWMENDPVLATSYAMVALRRCREMLAQ
jgi:squalene-hopene/tetraprenyl-beta-curcumene cyclase